MSASLLTWLAGGSAALAILAARSPTHLGASRTVARRLPLPGRSSRDAAAPVNPMPGAAAPGTAAPGAAAPVTAGRVAAGRVGVTARVAAAVRRVAGRPDDFAADVRLGRALVVGGGVAVLHPLAGLVAGGACWAQPLLQVRRARRAQGRAVLDGVVDVIDLVRLAVAAGLTVPLAVEAVAPRATGPCGEALAEVRRRAGLGVRWSEALEALLELGEPARPLAAALIAAERDGAPLGWPLEQAGRDARLARRRAAEVDARRLPVQLLFPLVLCTLPAFGLLTVVPLVVGTLGALPG